MLNTMVKTALFYMALIRKHIFFTYPLCLVVHCVVHGRASKSRQPRHFAYLRMNRPFVFPHFQALRFITLLGNCLLWNPRLPRRPNCVPGSSLRHASCRRMIRRFRPRKCAQRGGATFATWPCPPIRFFESIRPPRDMNRWAGCYVSASL